MSFCLLNWLSKLHGTFNDLLGHAISKTEKFDDGVLLLKNQNFDKLKTAFGNVRGQTAFDADNQICCLLEHIGTLIHKVKDLFPWEYKHFCWKEGSLM